MSEDQPKKMEERILEELSKLSGKLGEIMDLVMESKSMKNIYEKHPEKSLNTAKFFSMILSTAIFGIKHTPFLVSPWIERHFKNKKEK
jgi:hypothetical protein